jgi:ferrochelatase
MASEGVKRALAFVTSAYSSYSSCRQYIEDIVRARTVAGDHAPAIDKLRVFYNHPLFIQANVENINAAFEQLPELQRSRAVLIFTAHSIPQSMADSCEYEAQLKEASGLIASELGKDRGALVYQSRSGPLSQSWLEPDINDCLQQLGSTGTTDVVIAPIGFVSDHMEIVYDLDTQARSQCEKLGLKMVRASTVGTHPLFINMIRELILERIDSSDSRRSSGNRGPGRDFCATECCLRA